MSMTTFAHHKGRGSMHQNQTAGCSSARRRTRVPRIESLEDRTLLATLQFSGALGEQSTLDSVVQTADYLAGGCEHHGVAEVQPQRRHGVL